jgi:hypothetical protein
MHGSDLGNKLHGDISAYIRCNSGPSSHKSLLHLILQAIEVIVYPGRLSSGQCIATVSKDHRHEVSIKMVGHQMSLCNILATDRPSHSAKYTITIILYDSHTDNCRFSY